MSVDWGVTGKFSLGLAPMEPQGVDGNRRESGVMVTTAVTQK